ncbi:uncharacterized protein MELLADRAFT_109775 [Melampsora larici-populina 98AG31]|uniref:Uncharacterized protein n=1 Tax=Melampsora larici-populina (strain 98AG31 / pathotype 3-4-7) TaxID=747676 RepID=F4RXL5_MELLP|nr:uncharacterized protein MELLADRAFT_109775 [Melampsora larici-populina 98AG31]EGG02743.1 hypothetical protein MELLADRAFT_109775 [Melampsora larici-populina 98AG31]
MAFQLQLSNVVLKNLFTGGLRPDVKDRALKHPDWFKCKTVEERQAVAKMASEQIMHVVANSSSLPVQRSFSSPPIVPIPRDPNAMEVDVNAINARPTFPPLPNGISFQFFVKFCHARKMCHKCLKLYDSTHRTPDGKSLCPNAPPKTTQEIETFMNFHQSRGPSSVSAVSDLPQHMQRANNHRQPHVSAPPRSFQDVSAGFAQVPYKVQCLSNILGFRKRWVFQQR